MTSKQTPMMRTLTKYSPHERRLLVILLIVIGGAAFRLIVGPIWTARNQTAHTARTAYKRQVTSSIEEGLCDVAERDISGYRDLYGQKEWPSRRLGKVAVVDDSKKLSPVHFLLPDSLRAENYEEAETICWLFYQDSLTWANAKDVRAIMVGRMSGDARGTFYVEGGPSSSLPVDRDADDGVEISSTERNIMTGICEIDEVSRDPQYRIRRLNERAGGF